MEHQRILRVIVCSGRLARPHEPGDRHPPPAAICIQVAAGCEAGMAKDSTDAPPNKGLSSISELMRSIGQPLTPERSAELASALSAVADLEAKAYTPMMRKILRM